MGKVREAVTSWPNNQPSQKTTHSTSSTTLSHVPSDSSFKDLESELFAPIDPVAPKPADLVSTYMTSFEQNTMEVPHIDLSSNFDTFSQMSDASNCTSTPLYTPSSSLPSSCTSSTLSTPMDSPPSSPRFGAPFDHLALSDHLNITHHNNPILTPLSSGGYIYTLNSPYAHSNPHFPHHFIPSLATQNFTHTVKPVGPAIASRQEKLEKYRQKRIKRSHTRVPDQQLRKRAQSRSRDELGHFTAEKDNSLLTDLHDVKTQLVQSKEESKQLLSRLQRMEQEMAFLRQQAEQATVSQEVMKKQLAAQQQMNQVLLENTLLVPSDQTFSTIRPNSPYVKPFEEKIDLSMAAQDLTFTDSPFLESNRVGEEEFHHWDAMSFMAGPC